MKREDDIIIAEPKESRLHLKAVEEIIPDVSLLKTLKTVNLTSSEVVNKHITISIIAYALKHVNGLQTVCEFGIKWEGPTCIYRGVADMVVTSYDCKSCLFAIDL